MPASAKNLPIKKTLKPGMGLYQVLYWPNHAPDKSKPYAVVNLQTGDVNGRWHASKEEALAQARALYARLGDKAKVHSEEQVHNAFFLFADAATLVSDEGVKWVEAIAPKTYNTPAYGEVVVTPDKIDNFIRNINSNVRGQDIAINYEHGIDPSKGLKAAGWIKFARKNDNGNLELAVDFTDPAKQEIRNGEWKYFSLEWDDEWLHPDGTFYQDVVMGGGLTNRPVAKGLMPINFSEIFKEKSDEELAKELGDAYGNVVADAEYEFAVWSAAYVNSLPDSSFGFIEPGGSKDSDGKTEPRSLRHLPFKDANGKVDMPHVRNAIQRLSEAGTGADWKGFDDSKKSGLISRFKRMLGTSNMAEIEAIEAEYKMNEVGEWEHSVPGTGSPPVPHLAESGIADPDRTEGWRRDTPPYNDPPQVGDVNPAGSEVEIAVNFSEAEAVGYLQASIAGLKRIHTNDGDRLIEHINRILAVDRKTRSFNELQRLTNEVRDYLRSNNGNSMSETGHSEGGYTVGELTDKDLRELRSVLDVDDDGKIVEAIKTKFGELAALRDAVSASEQEKFFAEQYPQFYEQHQNLVRRDRETRAKNFSESVEKVRKTEGFGLKTTNQGLSTAAKEKIEEVHVKFSEGKANIEDFEEVLKAILHGGIVTFGELGSSGDDDIPEFDSSSATGVAGARKLFAEVVAKIRNEDPELTFEQAIAKAAAKHPDLAETYKVTLPA